MSSPGEVGATLRRLLGSFTVEITPREAGPAPLRELLEPGSAVYLTSLARSPWERTVAAAREVAAVGLRPVPHLAARTVADRADLAARLADLTALGITEVLLVAGSTHPVGAYDHVAPVLESGALEAAGITAVGFAGHPEGHPDVDDDVLDAALAAKARLAADRGLAAHVVTQFTFAAAPVLAWEHRLRGAGITLPVHVGLAGLTSPVRLLRFGLSCGVGPSLSVLRHQTGGVLKLATTPVYRPDSTLLELAHAVAADPDSLLRSVHFFPFGAVEATATWAADVRDGRHLLDEADHRTA